MGLSIDVLVAIFTVILTMAIAAERLIEIFKPLLDKLSTVWQPSVKIVAAILVGFGLSALFNFDLLSKLGVMGVSPIAGFALAGLIASAGSSVLHPILEWLKTLKNPDNTTTVSSPAGSTVTTQTTTSPVPPAA